VSDDPRRDTLARLSMRAHRRGIKEMDIILGRYSEARLEGMEPGALELFEALLSENDQDLYQWVTGQVEAPERFSALVDDISRVAFSGEYRQF